ncbi:MAG: hypothetical protein RIK87_00710 [Fuerstiella sp.]
MTTTKTKTRTKETTPEPETLRGRVLNAIRESDAFREAETEIVRLMGESSVLEAELDRLEAAANDTDALVQKIESGEQLAATDTADRIRVVRGQIHAYSVALARAQRRRKEVLRTIGKQVSADFAAMHRERVKAVADALTNFAALVQQLEEIPRTLRSCELEVSERQFPVFHLQELQSLTHRLNHFAGPYRLFLNEGGI